MLSRRWHAGHLLLLLLLLALLWFAARAVAVWRQPAPEALPDTATSGADLRLLGTFDPFFPAKDETDAPVTALALSLHGLRQDAATGRGSAILSASDGVQQVYAVGDEIGDGVTLAAIAVDHVLIDHQGVRESLWLDSGGAGNVQRQDPLAYQPMPVAIDDETMLPASDAPAPAVGAAMMPAVPADTGSGNMGKSQ